MMKFPAFDKNKNPCRYFFLKLSVLFVFVFVSDFLIGNLLGYYYFKQKRGADYLTTYSIDSTKADLLIFGSSRASHHYQPPVFEKRLHLSCYNSGRDGNFIFYHYAVLEAVLKRYSPKAIILDFDDGEFSINKNSYDRISSLLPYYKSHPEMRSVIQLKGPYEKLKLLSKIYPYNSSLLVIAGGNALFSKKKKEDIDGYIPLTNVWKDPVKTENNPAKYEIDSTKVKIYESFIRNCLRSKVKLYITCSPRFIKSAQRDYSIKLARGIAEEYKVRFYDLSEDSMFIDNSKLFADPLHLNNNGARLFSDIIADSILTNGIRATFSPH